MDLIISEQTHSRAAYLESKDPDALGPGEVSDTTLEELLDWLRTRKVPTKIDSTGSDVVISHFSSAEVETHRTTIFCDAVDREELIKALDEFKTVSV